MMGPRSDWYELLANLDITEAALLPPTEEARGEVRRFRVAPRLTQHVRHRTKYFDTPVAAGSAFVFTDNGKPLGESARTLRELAERVKRLASHVVKGHLRRRDFSNWIANLFGDDELADTVRELESQHQVNGTVENFGNRLAAAIDERYECGGQWSEKPIHSYRIHPVRRGRSSGSCVHQQWFSVTMMHRDSTHR
jgi:hypothetical protein